MVTKVTYVGDDFTRKPPKYERFIRPMVRLPFFLEFCKHNRSVFLPSMRNNKVHDH